MTQPIPDEVAVGSQGWGVPDTIHRAEDGTAACRLSRREDREFLVKEFEATGADPETVNRCSFCFETVEPHTGGDEGPATELRAADDPEEVLQS